MWPIWNLSIKYHTTTEILQNGSCNMNNPSNHFIPHIQCKKLVKNVCLPPGQVSFKVICPDERLPCPSHINNCYLSLKMPAAGQLSFKSYLPSSKVTCICSWAGSHFAHGVTYCFKINYIRSQNTITISISHQHF